MFKFKNELKIIAGDLNLIKNPSEIFEKLTIDFLSILSNKILNSAHLRIYSDLISFGFWCRKKNLLRIKESYEKNRLGRGIAFHICPSNVPMNFAFSMSLGLMSGNSNIVRLPSFQFEQVTELCFLINQILKKKKFISLKKKICLIKYDRSDKISEEISKISDVRIVWGGDKTVQNFKKIITKPRCLDINFPNRYSFSIINSDKFKKLKPHQIRSLAKKFYLDTFTMDQNGCSSPKAIFWIKKTSKINKEIFWNEIHKLAKVSFDLNLPKVSRKYFEINRNIINYKKKIQYHFKNFKVVRINIKNLNDLNSLESIQPGLGVFAEKDIHNLKILQNYITSRSQTMTYFGFKKKEIRNIIIKNKFQGIDRIVQIGNAFQMSNVWDGFDMINTLSREISLQ